MDAMGLAKGGSAENSEARKRNTVSPVVETQGRFFKIIVLGDMDVGKTCLTLRFCGETFQKKVAATIGVDFRAKTAEVDGEMIKLQLWDTAGQERFRSGMVEHYYRNVHGVIFVYDVTKRSSFYNLRRWIQECNDHNVAESIPRILIGNKCDVVNEFAISTTMAQQFADRHNMPLFETSAKDDSKVDNVEEILLTLVHKLRNNKPMSKMPSTIVGYRYKAGQDRVNTIEVQRTHSLSSSDRVGDSCACF